LRKLSGGGTESEQLKVVFPGLTFRRLLRLAVVLTSGLHLQSISCPAPHLPLQLTKAAISGSPFGSLSESFQKEVTESYRQFLNPFTFPLQNLINSLKHRCFRLVSSFPMFHCLMETSLPESSPFFPGHCFPTEVFNKIHTFNFNSSKNVRPRLQT